MSGFLACESKKIQFCKFELRSWIFNISPRAQWGAGIFTFLFSDKILPTYSEAFPFWSAIATSRFWNIHCVWQSCAKLFTLYPGSWENSLSLVSLIANIYTHISSNNQLTAEHNASDLLRARVVGTVIADWSRKLGRTTNLCTKRLGFHWRVKFVRPLHSHWLGEQWPPVLNYSQKDSIHNSKTKRSTN